MTGTTAGDEMDRDDAGLDDDEWDDDGRADPLPGGPEVSVGDLQDDLDLLEDLAMLDEFDELTVDFAFDLIDRRLACVSTGGLWDLGLPELYIRPPRSARSGEAMDDARTAIFLGTGLIQLGCRLVDAPGFEVPPYERTLAGRPVRFWLTGPEPPFPALAARLGPLVDTVIRVDCSLWHATLFPDQ